jgi:MFS family permease
VPFLPLVLLLVWQALSKSASFALGWATAIYFGQVPGRQGRVLSVISLVAAGWLILVVGFAIPIFGGAALEAVGVVEENFDVEPITYLGLVIAIVLTPPLIAAATVYSQFHEERTLGTWLRMVPVSYPATVMLGLSVLQMVAFTPILLFQRWRQKRKLIQVPLVMRVSTDDVDLVNAVRGALASVGVDRVDIAEATGP